jgi:hypothetical protein
MSSVNQGPCWDAGDMLGWGKAQGRAETSAHWTPSLWKFSQWYDTLKDQVAPIPLLSDGPPPCHPARLAHCRPTKLQPAGPLGSHPPAGPPAHQPIPTIGGLQYHQMPAPNLPRRCRQTGLYAKGITLEQLRLKFYCSWTWDFFSFFFLFSWSVHLVHCLSTISPWGFFWFSIVFSFFFYFFFLLLSWFC